MRTLAKYLLIVNLVFLLFIVLWLLVGGSQTGYFGGGAASEVDGILLMILAGFNAVFLAAVFFVLPTSDPGQAEAFANAVLSEATAPGAQQPSQLAANDAARRQALALQANKSKESFNGLLHGWSKLGLAINGTLILFISLYLALSSGRWGYFQQNATEVDMIVLFIVSLLNVGFMGLADLRFSRPRA